MAGVALGDIGLRFGIQRHFAWQAWRFWGWAGSGGAHEGPLAARDAAALCVAGVALGDIHRHFA